MSPAFFRHTFSANPRPTMMAAQRAGLGRIVGGTAGLAPGRTPLRTYAPCCIARDVAAAAVLPLEKLAALPGVAGEDARAGGARRAYRHVAHGGPA